MNDVCLFQLLDCPEDDLKHVLPKAPVRLLARLARAYPRTAGRPFMNLLSTCLSQPTLMFLREEIALEATPTLPEIRQAEAELFKLMRDYAKAIAATPGTPCSIQTLSSRIS
jgi:hypothetical protein